MAGMFASQRMMFACSEHLELPGRTLGQSMAASLRLDSPEHAADAFFALDPEYMAAPGEDYHSFRALAERSQLADNIKDTAVVTQVPELAVWERQVEAQKAGSTSSLRTSSG